MNVFTRLPKSSVLVTLCAVLAGFGNPALLACDRTDDDFQFDDVDMTAAIEGRYAGELEGKRVTVELRRKVQTRDTKQYSLPDAGTRRAFQCGHRSFLAAAHACISMSTLPVVATITTDVEIFPSGSFDGWFTVWGNLLSGGDLTFDAEGKHVLDATFRDGVIQDWTLTTNTGAKHDLALEPVE